MLPTQTLPPLEDWLPPLDDWLPASIRASAGKEEKDGDRNAEGDEDFQEIKRFIEEHLAEPFEVSDLSREANLTRPHFTRVFTERVGVPPWTYVQERRIQRAVELLDKGVPPSEVAFRTGFCDQSHLTRVFRKSTGTTPGEYRKDGGGGDMGNRPEDDPESPGEGHEKDRS